MRGWISHGRSSKDLTKNIQGSKICLCLDKIRPLVNFFFAFLPAGLVCLACSVSEFDSPESLNAYVLSSDSKLTQVQEINGYTIRVAQRPTDLLVHQEIEGTSYDSSQITALRKKYAGYYYFVVSFSKNSKEALQQVDGGLSQYSELVQTMAFRMGDYVSLTTSSRDTIPLGDFMLNRTYGLSQATDVLFVFNREKAKGKEWLQLNLKEFGLGVGVLRFRFSRSDLDKNPYLNFEDLSMIE
jgi:hypothetical protein